MSGIEETQAIYSVNVPKHVGNKVLIRFHEQTGKHEIYSDLSIKPEPQTAGSYFDKWSDNLSYKVCGDQTYPRSIEQRLTDIENKIDEILEKVSIIRKVVL